MTGRASPGKCATRTGPCFRSNRDFDTYTTFDILPPSRFFQPIPKWERRYSTDVAGFIKCLDRVAVVMVNSPMLARRLQRSLRRKSFPLILLRTLLPCQKPQPLCNQGNPNSFDKTSGVGCTPQIRPLLSTTSRLFFSARCKQVGQPFLAVGPTVQGHIAGRYSAPAFFVLP